MLIEITVGAEAVPIIGHMLLESVLVQAILLESLLVEAILLESVLVEAILLESVLVEAILRVPSFSITVVFSLFVYNIQIMLTIMGWVTEMNLKIKY
jgi:hypothetical protein